MASNYNIVVLKTYCNIIESIYNVEYMELQDTDQLIYKIIYRGNTKQDFVGILPYSCFLKPKRFELIEVTVFYNSEISYTCSTTLDDRYFRVINIENNIIYVDSLKEM